MDGQLVPAGLPLAVSSAAGALLEDRDRLVDPAEYRPLLLEHLHRHVRPAALLQQELAGEVEVGVRVVAVPDALYREAEDGRVETLGAGGRRHRNMVSRWISPALHAGSHPARPCPPRAARLWARAFQPGAGSRSRASSARLRASIRSAAPTMRTAPSPRPCRRWPTRHRPPSPSCRRGAARRCPRWSWPAVAPRDSSHS